MRLSEILSEEWNEEETRRAREWSSRKYVAVRAFGIDVWTVEDRLAIRDGTVAGPFNTEEEAWEVADELEAKYREGEANYYKQGGKGMMGGDVEMDWGK